MSDFKKQLLSVLGEIKGSGSFVSTGVESFVFPGLVLLGAEEIGFPVSATLAGEMIKLAHKAPFGKGSETVLDNTVRSAWEIDDDKITFANKDWTKFIDGIVQKIKPDLGIQEHSITANLYKLLIYEKDDFFVAHKDSEKEKGMFGTLIVGLPSTHTGGELVVSFDGKEETIDLSGAASQYKIPFAAFYADCTHEIKPITSGHRVCLVYNLVQTKGKEKIELNPLGGYAARLAAILKAAEEDKDVTKIVLLGHQYTPANFAMDALKLNDRPKAAALLQAAQLAGFYAKLCLVTSYQMGQLETDNRSSRSRRGYYDDDDDLENGTMGEIFDERLDIEHWIEDGVPPLRNITFEESDLISPVAINEGEPVEKEAEGYTGNAGMEMTYWYHYGAVLLWPQKCHDEMLMSLRSDNKLEWIAYYNKRWNSLTADEIKLAKRLVTSCAVVTSWKSKSDLGAIVDLLINVNSAEYVEINGRDILDPHFSRFSVDDWIRLFEKFPGAVFEKTFETAAATGASGEIRHLLAILCNLLVKNAGRYEAFIAHQTERLPEWLNSLTLSDSDEQAAARDILRSALVLGTLKNGDREWTVNTTKAITRLMTRNFVNDVLMAVIIESVEKTALATKIIGACKDDLVRKVDEKPVPPADWSRSVPNARGDMKIWNFLKDFLQSPVLEFFDYQALQGQRKNMENAISHTPVDLRTEIIRKGSPHTLRLIKTQDTYERELKKWKIDADSLARAEEWLG